MHLYVLACGNVDYLNRWLNDMTAQYFPYEYKKGEMGHLQLNVRPVQLLEIAFPEKNLPDVMRMMNPPDRKSFGVFKMLLRKFLKLKPVKEVPGMGEKLVIPRHIRIIPIGTRKDKYDKDGIEKI